MMKQKDLKPGVLPVAALTVGRGEVLMAPSPDRWVQSRSPGNVLAWPCGSWNAQEAPFDSKAGAASKKGGEATDCLPFGIWTWPWAHSFRTGELNTGCVVGPLRGVSRPSLLLTAGLACRNFTGFLTQHCQHISRPTLLPSPALFKSFSPNLQTSVGLVFSAANLPFPALHSFSLHFYQGLGCLWSFARTPNPRTE